MRRVSIINAFVFTIIGALLGVHPLRSEPPPRFPALSNEAALKQLPPENPTLPIWARTLAPSLPKTTASMLELDYLHRAKNPLGAVLYGKIRWVAADANSCTYSKQRAEVDLKREGLGDADLKTLAGDWKLLPQSERLLLDLARKISRAANQVTDDEMATLLKHYGPERVVAIVHALAHANFQDRIFLALGVETEEGGFLPPLDFRIDPEKKDKIVTPTRPAWKESQAVKTTVPKGQPDWLEHRFDDLQKLVADQKTRQARIPLPDAESLSKLPPELRERSKRIVWSHLSMGYQPQLTRAWFDCMGTFQKEASLDPIFSNTFFWVITRSVDCFY
jgi:hypothetical protein